MSLSMRFKCRYRLQKSICFLFFFFGFCFLFLMNQQIFWFNKLIPTLRVACSGWSHIVFRLKLLPVFHFGPFYSTLHPTYVWSQQTSDWDSPVWLCPSCHSENACTLSTAPLVHSHLSDVCVSCLLASLLFPCWMKPVL